MISIKLTRLLSLFSEVGGRTLLRLLVGDAGRETEELLLHETVPAWVTDVVVSVSNILFYLLRINMYFRTEII